MMNDILRKLGVKSVEELTPEERQTYYQWSRMIDESTVTTETVRKFLDVELNEVLNALEKTTTNERDDIFLKVKLQFIRRFTAFLDSPKKTREFINNQVSQL